ncbi:unnamed protein product [Phyllotreta striolata]|uniref:Phosphomevalonate kinase n=1 Tax=Phyllotreta striolata TaxID=444603 RepID=A0A9N9TNM7_PHYSR|nr:unnamed protein product [Phyllotreta striolata]
MAAPLPRTILLFSGKRKSGKDYICNKLKNALGDENCTVIRISEPLKAIYAKRHDLDLQELLSEGPYKEIYRSDMIEWSDVERGENPGIFCRAACESAILKPVWIVSDVRRKTDIEWFSREYGDLIKTIRITADVGVREQRGYVYTKGVDDVASECNLDDFDRWNLIISNNNSEDCESALETILKLVQNGQNQK